MKWDIVGAVLATGGAVSGLLILLYKVDPFQASIVIKTLFYFSLMTSIWGVLLLAGYGIRRLVLRNYIHREIIFSSFWQGLVVSIIIVVLLLANKFF